MEKGRAVMAGQESVEEVEGGLGRLGERGSAMGSVGGRMVGDIPVGVKQSPLQERMRLCHRKPDRLASPQVQVRVSFGICGAMKQPTT